MRKVPVSVVIPAYNSERFIGEAIESVLRQSVTVDEIIVVDNNCSDGTVEIAKKLGAIVVPEAKQNLSAARNRGISVSRNDWMAFLDSDDYWETEKIELQWRTIEKFPSARIISCDSFLLNHATGHKAAVERPEKISPLVHTEAENDEKFLFIERPNADLFTSIRLNASSILYHRDVFDAIGVFDESFLYGEALEFSMRAMGRFSVGLVRKDLVTIRRHDSNRTLEREAIDKYYVSTANKVAKQPELYPEGTLEYFREIVRLRFTAKGRELAKTLNTGQKIGGQVPFG